MTRDKHAPTWPARVAAKIRAAKRNCSGEVADRKPSELSLPELVGSIEQPEVGAHTAHLRATFASSAIRTSANRF